MTLLAKLKALVPLEEKASGEWRAGKSQKTVYSNAGFVGEFMYQHNAELARSARNLLAGGGLAELIRTVEDAERYRWLAAGRLSEVHGLDDSNVAGESLGAAIDRAREGK